MTQDALTSLQCQVPLQKRPSSSTFFIMLNEIVIVISHVLNQYYFHNTLNGSLLLRAFPSTHHLSPCESHILSISQTMLVKYEIQM